MSVYGVPTTIQIAAYHENADLIGYVGGLTAHAPEPRLASTGYLAPPRQHVDINFWIDKVGIVKSDHQWLETHSYHYAMPSWNVGRLANLY